MKLIKKAPLPKWYMLRARTKLKKDIIQKLLDEYQKPVKVTKKVEFKPTELDVKDYMTDLYKLNIKQLLQIGRIEEAKPKLSMMDKASKLNKKKALLVTIYHKNKSRSHYVCARHSRILKINEHTYLCPPNFGNFDNKYNMTSYSYYENNPIPITFENDYKPDTPQGITIPDGELLTKTLDFEFAQRLAHSKLKDKINLAVVFSVLAFLCSAACVVLNLQGFNII